MSSLNRPPFSVTTWMIPGRNNQTADFKDAPWLAEAGEITKDKVRIDQSEATLSEITTPSHGGPGLEARPCRLTLRVILLSLTQFWISDAKLDHRNHRFQLICPSFFCVFSLLRRYTTAEGEKTHQQKAQGKAHLLLSRALVCSKTNGDG